MRGFFRIVIEGNRMFKGVPRNLFWKKESYPCEEKASMDQEESKIVESINKANSGLLTSIVLFLKLVNFGSIVKILW